MDNHLAKIFTHLGTEIYLKTHFAIFKIKAKLLSHLVFAKWAQQEIGT